ncbi:LOW QUALITY PROTEIN: hypothetical protein TorRG33x02_151060 [Trema orientale]|uniref:Uncharacterized protein n=1 Tax=Trema orientale TaxID=63057 RepID=A0A2P5EUM2_TREOI|nr:LOW QUALITY PROTEIN: hypothetical protein TorRG33x02_151060 [Trema orientale]
MEVVSNLLSSYGLNLRVRGSKGRLSNKQGGWVGGRAGARLQEVAPRLQGSGPGCHTPQTYE